METKKRRFFTTLGVLAIILIVAYLLFLGSRFPGITGSFSQESIERISAFSEASVSKEVLTPEAACEFPGSMIFVAVSQEARLAVTAIPSLPKLAMRYDSLWPLMNHGNVSLINVGGVVYGVMPKHLFDGELDIASVLTQSGFKVSTRGDVMTIKMDNPEQAHLSRPLLKKIDSSLDNAPCTIKTLNCFSGDQDIYQYEIKGNVHYLNSNDQALILQTANNLLGGSVYDGGNYDGMYVIRVPNDFFDEFLGMAGGSVVVNFEGQEYFLGMNTMRLLLVAVNDQTTDYITLLAIQPVLKTDFN